MRFSAFVRVLIDGILPIVGGLVIGGLLGFGISYLIQPEYAATARVMVVADPEKGAFDVSGTGVVARDRVQNYRSLLMSIGLMQRAIDLHHLRITADELAAKTTLGSPVNRVGAADHVKTPLLDITTRGETAELAASYANGLADEFVNSANEFERQGPIHVRLVTAAAPPGAPASPDRVVIALNSALAGGIIGALFLFFFAVRDPKVSYLGGIRSIGHLPIVGRVRVPRQTQRSGRRSVRRSQAVEGSGVGKLADRLIAWESERKGRVAQVASPDPKLASLVADAMHRRREQRALVPTGHPGDLLTLDNPEDVLTVGIVPAETHWNSAKSFASALRGDGGRALLVIAR